jgi:hypothetical protein
MVLVLSSSLNEDLDQQETDPKQAAILTQYRCTNSDFPLCGAEAERNIFGYTTLVVLEGSMRKTSEKVVFTKVDRFFFEKFDIARSGL